MNFVEEAFAALFPEKNTEEYNFKVKYNGKFNAYNANVKYSGRNFQFNLSKKWRGVSKEIKIGLIQELMLKAFKEKRKTTNIDLYNIFLKTVHIAVPKTKIEPVLGESFDRVNEKYFFGLVERPNMVWGNLSVRKLGHYEYGSDTISISRIFKKADMKLLDYVMYHEMLHKKYKFDNKNGKNFHHTKKFKESERVFEDSEEMEKEISKIIRKLRIKNFFSF